ncbi:M14 family metallocarboxypeptidase [Luteolibacter algae]|uniref:M14 family metallocarboxypeptidase n=1 Tax=Luteolibacter algae TaxID=454151 RepID=A0ABW5DAX6_9BACT
MRNLFDWLLFSSDFSAAALKQGFTSEVLLETEDGKILAWEREPTQPGPVVYLSAGIHGDEPAGPLALLELMESGTFSHCVHWLICPALNPGGLAVGRRENRAGVDLNRDYLQSRSLETAAHIAWLKRHPVPEIFISFHEDWESTGFYFYEINCGEDCPQRARAILSAVSEVLPPEPCEVIDGHAVREPGWIFHCAEADLPDEWPEAIYMAKQGCALSYTLESPSQASLPERAKAHMLGFREIMSQHGLDV